MTHADVVQRSSRAYLGEQYLLLRSRRRADVADAMDLFGNIALAAATDRGDRTHVTRVHRQALAGISDWARGLDAEIEQWRRATP